MRAMIVALTVFLSVPISALGSFQVLPPSISIDVQKKNLTGSFVEIVNQDRKNPIPLKIEVEESGLDPETGLETTKLYEGDEVRTSRKALLLQPGESRRVGIIFDKKKADKYTTQRAFRFRVTQISLDEVRSLLPANKEVEKARKQSGRSAGVETRMSMRGWILLNPGLVEGRVEAKKQVEKDGKKLLLVSNNGSGSAIIQPESVLLNDPDGNKVEFRQCVNLKKPLRLHPGQTLRCRLDLPTAPSQAAPNNPSPGEVDARKSKKATDSAKKAIAAPQKAPGISPE